MASSLLNTDLHFAMMAEFMISVLYVEVFINLIPQPPPLQYSFLHL